MNDVNEVTKSIALRVIGWQTKFCPLRYTKSDKGENKKFQNLFLEVANGLSVVD